MIEEQEKVEHLFTSEQKIAFWGYGEWVEEPDIVEWQYKEFDCAIERVPFLGHLCGYVAVPKNHPWHEKSYKDIGIVTHDGASFKQQDSQGIVWIGFYATIFERDLLFPNEYRNISFMKKKCENLVDTLKAFLEE